MQREATISLYFHETIEQVKNEVISRSDEYLLGVNPDEFAQYLYEKYHLPKVEKDRTREITITRERAWREVDDFGQRVRDEIVLARIEYPIVYERLIEQVLLRTASRWRPGSQRFEYLNGALILRSHPEEIQEDILELEELLGWKNSDVESGNTRLKESIKKTISDRIDKIRKDKDAFEKAVQKVTIPLKMKAARQLPVLDLKIKKEMKILMPPKAEQPKEFILERRHVLAVLDMVKTIALQFEMTPAVYAKLEEEELRNIILSNLNTVFEGAATGETFSKLGKTDIHLKINHGNILIAECKYWEGEKAYHEAIDQLFRYLTWRQNYGIVIIFSRRQGFSKVLQTAKDCIRSHKTYKGGFSENSETHFASRHIFPDDPDKAVEIHHLFFNLYNLE